MKQAKHVGNVTLILDGAIGSPGSRLLLGLKRPKKKSDEKRRRKKVGSNRWVPPGGATEHADKSQKHSARREVFQETGLNFPLSAFRKAGLLRGYISPSAIPRWLVHIYVVEVDGYHNKLVPNEEYVAMKWFPVNKLPFNRMLTGDKDWIPRLIQGEKVSAYITFDDDEGNVVRSVIKPIVSFN